MSQVQKRTNQAPQSEVPVDLLKQLQSPEPSKKSFEVVNPDMRTQMILQGFAMAVKKIYNTYMPDGKLPERRQVVERAVKDAIAFSEMIGTAYDEYEAELLNQSNENA